MKWPVLTLPIEREDDVVAARQMARVIAERLAFGVQDQTRIATAVSEIARNAYGYGGGGKVEFGVDLVDGASLLVVRVSDRGPGVADLDAVLEGRYRSQTGMGVGITGARRLMDRFDMRSSPGRGTIVTLAKRLPAGRDPLTGPAVAALAKEMTRAAPENVETALREQNRELMRALAELAEREEEAQRLARELAETNRGVVALYAELENQAEKLREAGETLESQVAARTAELAEANERLRAEAVQRERMGAELRQSQKMEAVGQLTGGIAHDFNNLLTGIVGSLDLMMRRMSQGRTENLTRYAEAAMASASRAAALTHRLLAFARRQPLDPKPTDVDSLVAGMSDLLRRTISEAIDLRIVKAPGLWPTLCDPHQLENAILNLAINARDAMPEGGTLTVRTSNGTLAETVERRLGEIPPEHVRVCVSDTGVGMPPEVIARAFDPFFTTKALGQGTGLGLSMIYGFARQSEGHVRIESEVGRGTSVSLYLPRYLGPLLDGDAAQDAPDVRLGNGETILVVEDERAVRDLVVEVLRELGYAVLEAADGPSGLRTLRSSVRVDLLVSDIGLPGLDGRKLAELARQDRPDLKVLFVTGYAEDAARHGFLDAGMAMITKPFTVEVLTARIRSMIEDGRG